MATEAGNGAGNAAPAVGADKPAAKPGLGRTVVTALVAFAIGLCGGAAFYFLQLPLPWTLGSLFVAALMATLGHGRWLMPQAARNLARPVVGIVAGSTFTPAVAAAALHWWDTILIVFAFSMVTTLVGRQFFQRVGGFDSTTATFAASPGGLGEMTLVGGSLGGDMRRLVLVHVLRIVLTVATIPIFFQLMLGHPIGRTPLTAGASEPLALLDVVILLCCALAAWGLSRLTKFPIGLMVYAVIFSAIVHATGITHAVLPPWLTALMQVIVGSFVGSRFARISWRDIRTTLLVALGWAVIVIASAMTLAMVTSWALGHPFQSMVLALAPGGMVEMTVITLALGTDVAFVVTCQVSRVLLGVTLTPLWYKLFSRGNAAQAQN